MAEFVKRINKPIDLYLNNFLLYRASAPYKSEAEASSPKFNKERAWNKLNNYGAEFLILTN